VVNDPADRIFTGIPETNPALMAIGTGGLGLALDRLFSGIGPICQSVEIAGL